LLHLDEGRIKAEVDAGWLRCHQVGDTPLFPGKWLLDWMVAGSSAAVLDRVGLAQLLTKDANSTRPQAESNVKRPTPSPGSTVE
jgi:hypothetical protein